MLLGFMTTPVSCKDDCMAYSLPEELIDTDFDRHVNFSEETHAAGFTAYTIGYMKMNLIDSIRYSIIVSSPETYE